MGFEDLERPVMQFLFGFEGKTLQDAHAWVARRRAQSQALGRRDVWADATEHDVMGFYGEWQKNQMVRIACGLAQTVQDAPDDQLAATGRARVDAKELAVFYEPAIEFADGRVRMMLAQAAFAAGAAWEVDRNFLCLAPSPQVPDWPERATFHLLGQGCRELSRWAAAGMKEVALCVPVHPGTGDVPTVVGSSGGGFQANSRESSLPKRNHESKGNRHEQDYRKGTAAHRSTQARCASRA